MTAVEPETGRPHEALSRDELLRWVEEAVTGSEVDCQAAARELVDTITGLQRALRYETRRANLLELRALNVENESGRMRAGLEQECAALADALGHPAVTHEFEPDAEDPDACGYVPSVVAEPLSDLRCLEPADAPEHRTPARVRAEIAGDQQ